MSKILVSLKSVNNNGQSTWS